MRWLALLVCCVLFMGCGGKKKLPKPAGPGRAPAEQAAKLPGELVPIKSEASEPFSLGGLLRGNDNAQKVRGVGVDGGRMVASVDRRARRLVLYNAGEARPVASVDAGTGPTNLVASGDRVYVTDTTAGAVMIFRVKPQLELERRVDLPGAPYGIAVDPARNHLWVTLIRRNELVQLTADGAAKPGPRFPTVRRPLAVAVDPVSGAVGIRGATQVQILHP
jgi:sugar lactone lactonase YvrE